MISTENKKNLLTVLLLASVIWIAHFLNILHFGLYEDDYHFISKPWHFPVFLEQIRDALVNWPQGRPVGFFLPPVFSMIGDRLGGLPGIYVLGFLVLTLNASLYYALLRRISTEMTAVTAALAFCLFPADTTHIFLTHSLCLQFSLTFWLIAALGYLSGQRILPYLALTGALLTYESTYMVFLAVPLLREKWDRRIIRELLRNTAIMTAIALVVVTIRSQIGEERVVGMMADIQGVISKIAMAMIMGPVVSMMQFVNGPLRAVFSWNMALTLVSGASLVIMAWMLKRAVFHASGKRHGDLPAAYATAAGNESVAGKDVPHLHVGQLCLAGLAMLSLAYVLSFTHYPPVQTYGRLTSVHLASVIGGSLVFACLWTLLLSLANRLRLRTYAILLLSLYLSVIVAYRYVIQMEFRQAWQNQRVFWTQAVELMPDMAQDTLIFVDEKNLPKTAYILTHSWADPIILDQLFKFPRQWLNPPRLFVVKSHWPKALIREGNHFKVRLPEATWEAHVEVVPDYNVILLEMENGKLVRRFGTININGLDLHLKEIPPGASLDYEKGLLYQRLIN